MVDDGTPLSSSDYSMASKEKKNSRSTLKMEMKMNCYYLKTKDNELFKNRSKITAFVLIPLKNMLNFEVDRLSLQQLEYEMDCTDYPVDYNFLK